MLLKVEEEVTSLRERLKQMEMMLDQVRKNFSTTNSLIEDKNRELEKV